MQVVLDQGLLAPLARPPKVIDLLVLLWHLIVNEVEEILISARLSYYHITLVDLDEDLLCAKEVVSVAEAAHWQCTLHLSQVVADHFIDQVALDGPIVGRGVDLYLNLRLDVRRFEPGLLLKLLDLELFVLHNLLHLVKLVFALAHASLQELCLLVQLADVLLEPLVVLLESIEIFLQVDRHLALLEDLKRAHIDLFHEAELLLLVRDELVVHVHEDAGVRQQFRVHYALLV